MQKKAQNSISTGQSFVTAPPIVHEVLASPGQPLDSAARAFMEPRFGHDFSNVRVHVNRSAATSAREVNALAYTVADNIVFGAGRYVPSTNEGLHLIAHELAHVVQNHRGANTGLSKQLEIGASGTAAEEEANQLADAVTQNDKNAPKALKPKSKSFGCTRTILSEGTCADLVTKSKYICCDPNNGIVREGKDKDIDGALCPSSKFTPIFTCDNNCKTALSKGCSDSDNWMAIPANSFSKKSCGQVFTICANGKQTTGYVRDRSVTGTRFEVSPGIQNALGVTVGDSFLGSVYRPGASQEAIDKDSCCNSQPKPASGGDSKKA